MHRFITLWLICASAVMAQNSTTLTTANTQSPSNSETNPCYQESESTSQAWIIGLTTSTVAGIIIGGSLQCLRWERVESDVYTTGATSPLLPTIRTGAAVMGNTIVYGVWQLSGHVMQFTPNHTFAASEVSHYLYERNIWPKIQKVSMALLAVGIWSFGGIVGVYVGH